MTWIEIDDTFCSSDMHPCCPGVSITDYPDNELIETIRINVKNNVASSSLPSIHIRGYKWGADGEGSRGASGEGASTSELLALVRPDEPNRAVTWTNNGNEAGPAGNGRRAAGGRARGPPLAPDLGYDLILLSDVVFNHVAHSALLKRWVHACMYTYGCAYAVVGASAAAGAVRCGVRNI